MDDTLGMQGSASPEDMRKSKPSRLLPAKDAKPSKASNRKQSSVPDKVSSRKGKGKEPMRDKSEDMVLSASDMRSMLVVQEKELKAQGLKLEHVLQEMTATKDAYSSSLVHHEIVLKAQRMEGQRLSMTRVADVRHQYDDIVKKKSLVARDQLHHAARQVSAQLTNQPGIEGVVSEQVRCTMCRQKVAVTIKARNEGLKKLSVEDRASIPDSRIHSSAGLSSVIQDALRQDCAAKHYYDKHQVVSCVGCTHGDEHYLCGVCAREILNGKLRETDVATSLPPVTQINPRCPVLISEYGGYVNCTGYVPVSGTPLCVPSLSDMAFTAQERQRVAEHMTFDPVHVPQTTDMLSDIMLKLDNLRDPGVKCPHCGLDTFYPTECFHMTCPTCQKCFCWACGLKFRPYTERDKVDSNGFICSEYDFEYTHISLCAERMLMAHIAHTPFVTDKKGDNWHNRWYYFAGIQGSGIDLRVRNPHGSNGILHGEHVAGVPSIHFWNAENDINTDEGDSAGHFSTVVPKGHPDWERWWYVDALASKDWGNITELLPYRHTPLAGRFNEHSTLTREETWEKEFCMYTVAACFTCINRMREANKIVALVATQYRLTQSALPNLHVETSRVDLRKAIAKCIEVRRAIEEQVPLEILYRMKRVNGGLIPPLPFLVENVPLMEQLIMIEYNSAYEGNGSACMDPHSRLLRTAALGMPYLHHDATMDERRHAVTAYALVKFEHPNVELFKLHQHFIKQMHSLNGTASRSGKELQSPSHTPGYTPEPQRLNAEDVDVAYSPVTP